MARFLELYAGSPHAYFINLEQVEQVNPEASEVYMMSGECYALNDEDFDEVMDFVKRHKA